MDAFGVKFPNIFLALLTLVSICVFSATGYTTIAFVEELNCYQCNPCHSDVRLRFEQCGPKNASVCYKRIIDNIWLGRGGADNNRTISKGCIPLKDVRSKGWEIGCHPFEYKHTDTTQCFCTHELCNCAPPTGTLPSGTKLAFVLLLLYLIRIFWLTG